MERLISVKSCCCWTGQTRNILLIAFSLQFQLCLPFLARKPTTYTLNYFEHKTRSSLMKYNYYSLFKQIIWCIYLFILKHITLKLSMLIHILTLCTIKHIFVKGLYHVSFVWVEITAFRIAMLSLMADTTGGAVYTHILRTL